jgi:hypothetical protein
MIGWMFMQKSNAELPGSSMQVMGVEGVFNNCTNNRMSRSKGWQRAALNPLFIITFILYTQCSIAFFIF